MTNAPKQAVEGVNTQQFMSKIQDMAAQLRFQGNRNVARKSDQEQISFNVKELSGDSGKTLDHFMDKSLTITSDELLKSINEFKDMVFSDSSLKRKFIAACAAFGSASQVAVANAADQAEAMVRGNITYSRFLEAVQTGQIETINVDALGREATYRTFEGTNGHVNLFNDPSLLDILNKANVDVNVFSQQAQGGGGIFSAILPVLIVAGIFFFLTRRGEGDIQMPGGGPNPFSMGKSKAKVQMNPDTGVKFDDVAGVNEAKSELTEMVDFLKTPEKYTVVGAKIPRGALLVGPPGTGKTLLAKAVAGEAGVPFFNISAAEFIEMFVGVGASRVRDLFNEAKKNAPCIVFIDELDAVGRQRAQGQGMGNDEREQTVNQLLTEMDGFDGNSGVIVLAATNIPDVLDKALLRPGRFDRQIQVGLPDQEGRTKILGVHSKGKKLSEDVNLGDIAKRCMGMSGADLANVMNEAAIFAARKDKKDINSADVFDAIDRIQIGLEKEGGNFSEERQKLVAYHEAGHAILGALMSEYDLVNKISIVPRGGAGGVTIFTPNEEAMESGMYSKEFLENRICVGMGGRIAE